MTFAFYSDPGLTTLAREQVVVQSADTPEAVDRVVYFGSRDNGAVAHGYEGNTISQLRFYVVDSGAGGSPASDVRLALTQAGLDDAVAGARLDIDGTLASGVANAVAIWMRVLDSTGETGMTRNLSVQCQIKEVTS